MVDVLENFSCAVGGIIAESRTVVDGNEIAELAVGAAKLCGNVEELLV
jgi:hypothetical protein